MTSPASAEPTAEQRAVIFALFPDLADRVFLDWSRLEFSTESQQQIANVTDLLAAAVTAEREASVAAIEELWDEDCGNRRPERCASCRAYDGAIRRVQG